MLSNSNRATQVVVRDLVVEMRCTYNHHLNTVHITYYILFFPQHDKTSVKEVVDDLSLFWWEYKSWRMCVNPVKEEQKRICYPCVALLFFPLNFVLHLTIQQTISGMRVLVAWWNHHLSALGINPSCQRRSMNSVSSNAACWVGISIPIRQTLIIVHCKGWCFILSLLNIGVHFSAHAVA